MPGPTAVKERDRGNTSCHIVTEQDAPEPLNYTDEWSGAKGLRVQGSKDVFFPIAEAAKYLNVDIADIRRAIVTGELRGSGVGPVSTVAENELRNFKPKHKKQTK
jgi:hypothetical protein